MKLQLKFKDGPGVERSIAAALTKDVAKLNLPKDEADALLEIRQRKVAAALRTWIKYDCLITVDFDLEKGTATVVKLN